MNKLSSLWTDYKVGQYELPDDSKSVTEEVVEEKAAKMKAAVVAVKEEPTAAQEGTQEDARIAPNTQPMGQGNGSKVKGLPSLEKL